MTEHRMPVPDLIWQYAEDQPKPTEQVLQVLLYLGRDAFERGHRMADHAAPGSDLYAKFGAPTVDDVLQEILWLGVLAHMGQIPGEDP